MIITGVYNLWDTVYGQVRQTVYRTLEDPVTNKQVIQIEHYLYDKTGNIPQNNLGNNIDKQA
jgi:hypothetical protein